MIRALLSLVVVLALATTACTTVVKATSDGPIEPETGKRTFGTYLDDEQIETTVAVNIAKSHPDLNAAHINVHAYNGVVLLTGQVQTPDLRRQASEIASAVPKVRQVHNELQVQGHTGFLARSNDVWIGTKIRSKLIGSDRIESARVKVIVENGVVYMMGLLSRDEALHVTDIARGTGGVQRVVKVFEYID